MSCKDAEIGSTYGENAGVIFYCMLALLQTDAMSSPCWTGSPQELESRLADLQSRYDQLVAKNAATVSELQAEVEALHQQVRQQADELAWIQSCGISSSTVSELLSRLRCEHEALLQRHLEDIRNECLRICSSGAINCTASEPVNSSQSQLVDDVQLTGSCAVDDSQTAVSCKAVSETGVTTQTDSLHDATLAQKRRLSPHFDLECTSADRLLAKNTKLF